MMAKLALKLVEHAMNTFSYFTNKLDIHLCLLVPQSLKMMLLQA